ncbi:MAG: tetratricopeptide repeat protein [Muribaculaceae bacterium]|nr:tetratricopeptide repeat protein [Muribaculaceae bacterium]
MKRLILLTTVLGAAAASTDAQINNPDARGYLDRAIAMLENDRNYGGCIDQLARLYSMPATAAEREEALYYMGLATLRAGDDDALPLLERFLGEYPVSPRRAEVASLIGDYRWDRGDYAASLAVYEKINPMALTPGRCDEMNFRMAYAYMLLGESKTAEQLFRTLLGKDAWRDTARFYIGYLAYASGDYKVALDYLRQADTTTAPGNAAPYYIAQIEYAQGDYEKSLKDAQAMLADGAVKEFIPECNRLAGESLYNLGRTREAIPYLWKYCAEAKTPQPSAFYILGTDEYAKGDTDAAIKLLQQATDSPSAMGQSAWLYLGQAYMKRGDKSSAMMAFGKAYGMDFDPKVREEAFYNYAVARLDGGRIPFGNSVALLEQFLKEYPRSAYAPEVERYIVEGYMTDNDYESALAAIRRVGRPTAAMTRAKQRALFVLGTRALAAGKTGEALRDLTEARSIEGDATISRQCDLWLGDAQYARGDYDRAASSYLAYLSNPLGDTTEGTALARYGLGYTRFAQEEFADAATDFTKAAQEAGRLDPETRANLLPDIYNRLGDCLYYEEDYEAALKDYERAYTLKPAAGDYPLFQSAVMKGHLRDYPGKLSTLDKMIAAFPSSGLVPQAMLEKAETQSATGSTSAAIRTYNELVRLYPSTAPGRNGYLQLAITYINSGDRKKGIETYRKVITTFPTSEEARIAADDLRQIYAADGKLDELVGFLASVPGAPRYDASEIEQSAWQAAENAYVSSGATAGLSSYIADYPSGASRAQALYYLAESAWNAGDSRTAQGYATQVLLGHPDAEVAEEALLIKAKAEMEMGKTEIAHSSFLELESKASGSNMLGEARTGIIRTASDLGRYAEVVATADKMLASTAAASSGETEEIRFLRAMANNRLGNRDEAYADWELLERDLRSPYGARAAYHHAQALFDAGKTDAAFTVADKLISSDTPQAYWLARGFILYSDILRKQGKKFEADEYLKSLRSNYPGTEADIFEMIDNRIKING